MGEPIRALAALENAQPVPIIHHVGRSVPILAGGAHWPQNASSLVCFSFSTMTSLIGQIRRPHRSILTNIAGQHLHAVGSLAEVAGNMQFVEGTAFLSFFFLILCLLSARNGHFALQSNLPQPDKHFSHSHLSA
jgi:hypothetical protein